MSSTSGDHSFEDESFESLQLFFIPFIQKSCLTTLGTPDTSPDTSRMDISKNAPNKGIFLLESGSTTEIIHFL